MAADLWPKHWRYEGTNPTATGDYDLHQYTSKGRLPGYQGPLDLSRLASHKPATFSLAGRCRFNQPIN